MNTVLAFCLISFMGAVSQFAVFAGRSLIGAIAAITRPRDFVNQFYTMFIGALPLATVAGLTLGVVIWIHLRGVLARFGGPSAVELLPSALTLAVVLEFAPIGSGLIAAGRAGAGLGAELGAMRISEQIDALEILGVSPIRQLVGPRVLACALALPLLTVFIDYLAVAGSFVAEYLSSGMTWLHYESSCLRGLRVGDVIPATLKTLVFGFLIGVSGCFCGLRAEGGTEGVGRAATRGVILSTFCVLLANVILVRLIQVFHA